ncbi:hypothetical protein IEQ34_020437 [Dendrobium chrysotoxum]|uniref:Uncharacterized protein n=1 Tax=Dendrobium chrysotoxum TaxID=161865 RepID=A0AAV7FKI6_DENCH|nr:hypothetical protein IEQ34_020437 [Dendrobium chrysotoxum]
MLQKAVLGREPTPAELHSHTHKRQEDQRWVDERARKAFEYTRIRESQTAVGEGSSGGSTEYSDYRTWSQVVGGMQHGRVYGLGSQAYAYEGQTSSGCNFSYSTQESLYTQQITALTAELEHVRKAQADWQMQMQQQVSGGISPEMVPVIRYIELSGGLCAEDFCWLVRRKVRR